MTVVVMLLVVAIFWGLRARSERVDRERMQEEDRQYREHVKRSEAKQKQYEELQQQQLAADRQRMLSENLQQRERLAAQFPDAYRELRQKTGKDLSECIVKDLGNTDMTPGERSIGAVCDEFLRDFPTWVNIPAASR